MGDLAEPPVELDETAREVVAAVGLLAVVLEDERIHLLLQQLHVGGERQHVLDGAVVEIEAETHQPAFGGGDERSVLRSRSTRAGAPAR